ncbi:MAG: cyclohexa-1,5-dienecarbonyl-CoA hydratase, partial [Alphaproteobacteria bacterium]
RPKANIVDAEMIGALDAALDEHLNDSGLKAVLIDAEGPHFSFGASVEEHMPENCADMIKAIHALILRIAKCPVPVLVAVRGQCLGGGLEVALAGNFIFAAPDTKLGQPEIVIGVFAPAASCLLPARVGQAMAEDMLFSGRSLDADEALAAGLVNGISDDPEAAALDWFDRHLADKSASSLGFAVRGVREDFTDRLEARLAEVEALYLDGLMSTRDAVEGLEAFTAKRAPKWENR